jgi:hypothetical protein
MIPWIPAGGIGAIDERRIARSVVRIGGAIVAAFLAATEDRLVAVGAAKVAYAGTGMGICVAKPLGLGGIRVVAITVRIAIADRVTDSIIVIIEIAKVARGSAPSAAASKFSWSGLAISGQLSVQLSSVSPSSSPVVWTHPLSWSQESTLQAMPSSQLSGV